MTRLGANAQERAHSLTGLRPSTVQAHPTEPTPGSVDDGSGCLPVDPSQPGRVGDVVGRYPVDARGQVGHGPDGENTASDGLIPPFGFGRTMEIPGSKSSSERLAALQQVSARMRGYHSSTRWISCMCGNDSMSAMTWRLRGSVLLNAA